MDSNEPSIQQIYPRFYFLFLLRVSGDGEEEVVDQDGSTNSLTWIQPYFFFWLLSGWAGRMQA